MSDPLPDFMQNACDWIENDDESESGTLHEFHGHQIRLDIIYGILRDWTCIAAGLRGPWSECSENPLTNLPDECQPSPSCSSTTAIPEWDASNTLVSTDPEDFFSINGHVNAARVGGLFRSRRRPARAGLPVSDLIDHVSSPKRRRVLRDSMVASNADALVGHGNLGNGINAFTPSSSRNPEARASADRRFNSEHQQTKLKPLKSFIPRSVRTEDWTNCQRTQETTHPSRVPLTPKAGCYSALFVSELIPSNFTSLQRFQVLDVLHYEAPYIPTCIVGITGQIPQLYFGNLYCNKHLLPEHIHDHTYKMSQIQGSPLVARPTVALPVEVLAHIARYLNRLDMQALLLTSKDFNAKLGPLYFQHVVLPFKSNIFSGLKNTSSIDSKHGNEKVSSSATGPAASTASTSTGHTGAEPNNLPSELNMFRTWGSSIMKFGFSLEVDEDELTNAPEKQITNMYRSFYAHSIPWPQQEYLLNPTIERLDMTADQKNLMELALSSLTNVNELALSVDSGLGYLEGFDKSDRAKIVADKAKFFGRRFALTKEDEIRLWLKAGSSTLARFSLHDRQIYNAYLKVLRKIPRHADTLISLVTYYMNKNPRGTLTHLASVDIFGHVKSIMFRAGIAGLNEHPQQWSTFEELLSVKGLAQADVLTGSLWNLRNPRPTHSMLHNTTFDPNSHNDYHSVAESGLLLPESFQVGPFLPPPDWVDMRRFSTGGRENLEIRDKFSMTAVRDLNRDLLMRLFCGFAGFPPSVIFDGIDICDQSNSRMSQEAYGSKPLKPSVLKLAQKQWLVETGWMQQTFITSYLNSIIKNKSRFATVRSFTLAKLSSRYLPRLHDREFWDALGQLENLTILVSPDWREIVSGHEGEFSSTQLAPSDACSMLMKLLQELSSIASIKSLKTGFIGGGEHAVGLHARNQHILPAPITDESRSNTYIVMPFIEHLTFVNCWFVPSTLMEFLKSMIHLKLRTVHFDSVSLIVAGGRTTYFEASWPSNFPPEIIPDPSTNTVPPFYLGFTVPQPGFHNTVRQSQITPSFVLPRPAIQDGYRVPVSWKSQRLHNDTWAKIIDAYTPGQTLKDKQGASAQGPPKPRSHGGERERLASLKFTSCGYARLEYQHLGPVLDELEEPEEGSYLARRKAHIEVYMMKSSDPFLAEIVPKILHPELALLTGAFGMTVGPGDDPGRLDNREDGRWDRGTGRFSGEVGGRA
ncbi:hypothetical protein MMC26_005165 [Xylographa opegraphella]|nr:hypothetical protein [Xylographa opegraphella]